MPLINSLYMYNFTSFTDIHAYIYIIPMSFYCINSALTLTKKRIIIYDKKYTTVKISKLAIPRFLFREKFFSMNQLKVI